MHGLNAAGGFVKLEDVFPAFIDATAEVVHQLRGADGVTIFNLVRNWPLKTVAPSDEDAVYIELWDPYTQFMDLPRVVAQAQALGGGKPVIIAAYIHAAQYENARLANALIFASGGYHLELGEPSAMLADPYFPKFDLMTAADQEIERRYTDFLVRYENVLALGTGDGGKDRAGALTIEGVKTVGALSTERVAVVARQVAGRESENSETFSLVNLMGIGDGHWNGTETNAPTPFSDLDVQIQVTKPVAKVWLASPDGDDSSMQAVDFTAGEGTIAFRVPSLAYWTIVVVEYQT
jgi:dextranase